MKTKSETIPMNVAIDLGSLEIRKLFKDLNSTALDKKVNIDYLEKELGLRKFFPQSLIESQKVTNHFVFISLVDRTFSLGSHFTKMY